MAKTRSTDGSPPRSEVVKEGQVENGNHVEEGSPAPNNVREGVELSAAPEKDDVVHQVSLVIEKTAQNEGFERDKTVPDPVNAEPTPPDAAAPKDHVNDVVPMDEEALKNEKKRGREKEIGVEDEPGKTSKAAKTETGVWECVENRSSVTKVEDEVEGEIENGDGVEVVEGAVIGDDEPGKTKRLKKRKIAMIIAYCGANYQGMQRNPGAITIEGELEQALYRAGAITKENFGVPRKIDWMRAARTDKGVSALGQIVSGQFIIEPEGFVERVNSFLPRDIVVLGYKRVTSSFNAKKLCDKRRYEYIIPTYCFDPSKHLNRETANSVKPEDAKKAQDGVEVADAEKGVPAEAKGDTVDGKKELASNGKEEPVGRESRLPCEIKEDVKSVEVETTIADKVKEEHADGGTDDPVKVKEVVCGETVVSATSEKEVITVDGDTSNQTEVKKEGPYKFDEPELNRLNRILARYKGTHNYHNFTARTPAEDPSAHRFIIYFEAEDILTIDGIEFVRLHVIGQSFMLHQIRKMVGLVVAIMRGAAPESVMDFALRKDTKFNVPMAPELGLFLEECYYSSYNKKFKSTHEELSLNDYKDAVIEFKKKSIYTHIASTETRDKVFPLWLHGMNDSHYPDFVAAREGTYKPGNRTSGKAA